MSRNYDNWERLVAVVLRREQFRKMCLEHSRTPSLMSSASSDFSSSFRLSSSLSNASFDFERQKRVLEFFKDSPFKFDLEELLMASSDVLGGGEGTLKRTFLVSLKKNVKVVVVKISKLESVVPIEVLEELIKIHGSIDDENVVKLRGFCLSKGEMLGFHDYFAQGSVHQMLHGKGGYIDWETRLRIAVGAANGLAYMHKQFDGKFVHGNIKASNIFLNSQGYGCLGDVFTDFQISEYHPPEVRASAKMLSRASDVYSFGVFLIELLSGKSPLHHTDKFINFVDWACDERRRWYGWTAMVFDRSLLKNVDLKKQMREMLGIALACVKEKAEERPNMNIVVDMLSIMCGESHLYFMTSYQEWIGGQIKHV